MESYTLDFIQHSFSDPIAEAIKSYTATSVSDSDTFKSLMIEAYSHGLASSDQFAEHCFNGEKEVLDYLEENHGVKATYRRKDGTIDGSKGTNGYKLSKVCSVESTYSSAKAVIGKALDSGVSLVNDDGSYKGKTQLEKEVREYKETQDTGAGGDSEEGLNEPELSEFEKAISVLGTLVKIQNKLDSSDKAALRQAIIDSGLV